MSDDFWYHTSRALPGTWYQEEVRIRILKKVEDVTLTLNGARYWYQVV